MDTNIKVTLQHSAHAMQGFKREFGVELSDSRLCEIYVALQFGLPLPSSGNPPGCDLQGCDGTRYQVKCRKAETQNLDFNNFDFDFAVLVNLSDDYLPLGMWMLGVDRARPLATERGKFRKFQIVQSIFKGAADPVDIADLKASLVGASA